MKELCKYFKQSLGAEAKCFCFFPPLCWVLYDLRKRLRWETEGKMPDHSQHFPNSAMPRLGCPFSSSAQVPSPPSLDALANLEPCPDCSDDNAEAQWGTE